MAVPKDDDADSLRQAETALGGAAAARDAEAVLAHFAAEAVVFPPNAPEIRGWKAVGELIRGNLAVPGFSIRTELQQAEAFGDLGYTLVGYETEDREVEGRLRRETGRVLRLWKRQGDGEWKVILEIMSAER